MPATLISNAEFELMPETEGKQELLEGELITLPPAQLPHARISEAFFLFLLTAFEKGRVHTEWGYQMSPRTWLQPDVSVTWPDQPEVNDYLQGAPMIAVEVVSDGNTAQEIDRKVAAYLRHGAAEVWIVYPLTRSMLVHTKASVERITDSYKTDLIPGAVVKLAEILGAGGTGED